MEAALAIAEGPLFRLAFAVFVFGLARQTLLILWPAYVAWRRARDRSIQWRAALLDIGSWLVPVRHFLRTRQFSAFISYSFHFGLILVPLFLSDHTALWAAATGVRLPALPDAAADGLTVVTMSGVLIMLLIRAFHPLVREFANVEDYVVLMLILVPFVTGYASGRPWNPFPYDAVLLVHIISGSALLIAIPFSKLSHCIFFPLSRICAELGAKLAIDVRYEYPTP